MSSINLNKGECINLSKETPGLKKVFAAAGWDVADGNKTMDLDLCVFLNNSSGKMSSEKDFIYFNNKTGANGAVKHSGDNLTGAGDGDDEQIAIDLSALPESVTSIPVVVVIYNASKKGQTLADLKNAFVRVVNQDGGAELAKYEITAGLTGDSILFGEFTKANGEWSFTAKGETGTGEFNRFIGQYSAAAAA